MNKQLTLRLVVIRNEYAFAVCVGDEAVIAYSSYKQAALELQAVRQIVGN